MTQSNSMCAGDVHHNQNVLSQDRDDSHARLKFLSYVNCVQRWSALFQLYSSTSGHFSCLHIHMASHLPNSPSRSRVIIANFRMGLTSAHGTRRGKSNRDATPTRSRSSLAPFHLGQIWIGSSEQDSDPLAGLKLRVARINWAKVQIVRWPGLSTAASR